MLRLLVLCVFFGQGLWCSYPTLAAIKQLPQDTTQIEIHDATEAELEALARFANLQVLHIGQWKPSDRAFAALKRLDNLVELRFTEWSTVRRDDLRSLATLSTLRRLAIECPISGEPNGESGEELGALSSLEEFRITGFEGCGAIIKALASLENLTTLAILADLELRDQDLAPLAAYPKLRALELNWCTQLTEGVFEHLGPLNQLRDLDLDAFAYGVPAGWTGIFRTPWTVSGLSKLKGFKSLTRLNLRGGEVLGDDECALIARQFPALEFLSVACCQEITDAGIRSLAGLRQLKELRAYGLGSAMTGKGFDAFSEHTALTHLDVGLLAEIDDSGLAAVAAIPKLSRLHLYHGELTEDGYAHLSKAVHLRELTTAHEGFSPKALEAISKCTQLQVLRILNASMIRSDDYKLLRRFTDLRELRILGDAYHLSDAAMEHLGSLTSLRRLTLINAPISNSGLLALKDLKNLTQLQIEGQADFSDALEGLKTLEALEILRLDNCKGIGPKAVRDIASLPRLRDLTITFPQGLTGKVLLPLKDAPALRSVQVWGKVDGLDEGVAALSKAAPLIAAKAGYRGH